MFTEERLDLGFDYGTVATLTTKTSIIESKNGTEQRTIDWYQPLLRFDIGERTETNARLEEFIAFHQARKGSFEGFRFKDWSDYKAENVLLAYGDGVRTSYQLFKPYQIDNYKVHRPITKPVQGTVNIYVACELYEDYTIDYSTGEVVFDVAPTGPVVADFEFDVPVRFERDKIDLRFQAYEKFTGQKIFEKSGLSLIEIRVPPAVPISLDPVPASLDGAIDLGYDYGTIGGNEFATKIERLVSSQERRTSDWTNPRGTWEIGTRTLDIDGLDYLLALFRVCRGKAIPFKYFDRAEEIYRAVRFGEDAIAFRFDAYEIETEKVIFWLSGIPLVATGSPVVGSIAPLKFIPTRRPATLGPTILFNTGYGTGWDRPVSNNSYGWNGAGNLISKWLTYPPPAPTISSSENFDWEVSYSFQSNACQLLRARFMVDNLVMSLTVNGVTAITGPIGGFSSGWTEFEFYAPIGSIVLVFIVRNLTEGATEGFATFNPTGFRLEWL